MSVRALEIPEKKSWAALGRESSWAPSPPALWQGSHPPELASPPAAGRHHLGCKLRETWEWTSALHLKRKQAGEEAGFGSLSRNCTQKTGRAIQKNVLRYFLLAPWSLPFLFLKCKLKPTRIQHPTWQIKSNDDSPSIPATLLTSLTNQNPNKTHRHL